MMNGSDFTKLVDLVGTWDIANPVHSTAEKSMYSSKLRGHTWLGWNGMMRYACRSGKQEYDTPFVFESKTILVMH